MEKALLTVLAVEGTIEGVCVPLPTPRVLVGCFRVCLTE